MQRYNCSKFHRTACHDHIFIHFIQSYTSDSRHEKLHAKTTKDKIEGGPFLDVVVVKNAITLQLLSIKYQYLLFRMNTFFLLNLSLNSIDIVNTINVKNKSPSDEDLDRDSHLQLQGQNFQMMIKIWKEKLNYQSRNRNLLTCTI